MFRRALETAIDNESQPIAERLLRQLPDLIRDCQDTLFSNYRAGISDADREIFYQRQPPPLVSASSSLPLVRNSLKGPETVATQDTGYESDSPLPPSPYPQNTKEGDTHQKSSQAKSYDDMASSPSNLRLMPGTTSEHLPRAQEQGYTLVTPDEMWGPYPTDVELDFVDWTESLGGG